MLYVNTRDADQPAHPRSLIKVFVVRSLDSIFLVAITAIPWLLLVLLSRAIWVLPGWKPPRQAFFGVFNQVRLKPACSATEASMCHEIANIETREILLSRQQTTKMLFRLCGCAGWSAPLLLLTYGINRFSRDKAQLWLVSLLQVSTIGRH